MERYTISGERAFLLTRISRDNNRKLYDIVDELVRTRVITNAGSPPV